MRALIASERIKLFSTRTPYWCLIGIVAGALAWAVAISTIDGGRTANTVVTQAGAGLGMMILMVMAALAATAEYRYGTIATTFLAVPGRGKALIAKTALLLPISGAAGAIAGLGAFYLTKALAVHPQQPLLLDSGDQWRIVLAKAALYPIAAIIALAVGTLVRHSAGAITILLGWPLLIETLVQLIPRVGRTINLWMPFTAGASFGSETPPDIASHTQTVQASGPTPLQGLVVFLAVAIALWAIALVMIRRRDV